MRTALQACCGRIGHSKCTCGRRKHPALPAREDAQRLSASRRATMDAAPAAAARTARTARTAGEDDRRRAGCRSARDAVGGPTRFAGCELRYTPARTTAMLRAGLLLLLAAALGAKGAEATEATAGSRLQRACAAGALAACARVEAAAVLTALESEDAVQLWPGVTVRRQGQGDPPSEASPDATLLDAADATVDARLTERLARFAGSRVLVLDLPRLAAPGGLLAGARALLPSFLRPPSIWSFIKLPSIFKPSVTGKSSFLTGFGLGFLAFALKKLLLPIIIGGQIVKSVLIAMFLPSILGGLGKLVGKGVTTFASASGSSGGLSGPLSGSVGGGGGVDDFGDFKEPGANYGDTEPAGTDAAFANAFSYPDAPQYGSNGVSQPGSAQMPTPISRSPLLGGGATALYVPNRYQAQSKVSQQAPLDNFYMRNKQQDFKVFHQIPASSLLLTHYDPFYSPLLSRLDSVFTQLGYSSEACRERLVCAMYDNPARFAPYSNLVSAQLSRELNELRKPSSDNPEILRFFRYMKAAKDGQDGLDCFTLHPGCVVGAGAAATGKAGAAGAGADGAPPMLKTYQDINKLVQARRLARTLRLRAQGLPHSRAQQPAPTPEPAKQQPTPSTRSSRAKEPKPTSEATT